MDFFRAIYGNQFNRRWPMRTKYSFNKINGWVLSFCFLVFAIVFSGCASDKSAPAEAGAAPKSKITVTQSSGGPIAIKSSAAEFDILSNGYVQGFLIKDG